MYGYVEMMERLEYLHSRKVTDAEVRQAMGNESAARVDIAREERWQDAFDPATDACEPDAEDKITEYSKIRGE
jgi:hypothetical protein